MSFDDHLTTAHVHTLFADEVQAAGGTVSDTFDDGRRLFARSVLPAVAEVQPGDRVQGGVAIRACQGQVWVHPYVFRQVCRNGAIVAHAVQTRHLADLDSLPADEADEAVREAVRCCCAAEAFTTAAAEMRNAVGADIDVVLNLMPFLSRLGGSNSSQFLGEILGRFFGDADRSRFGLMNAVTSLARDTRDPEVRWRLEEFGGGVPVLRAPDWPAGGARGAARREMVGAGRG
ncbi:MAG TPA: hypothetical protein VKA46_05425 [Gemmataceae bacterium]|nr:hypothetical protein [Gemmataceae bacterium]